ncbi:MAG: DUF4382 domain-containing protein, partial [Candidatus Acidiferrales bacterium]
SMRRASSSARTITPSQSLFLAVLLCSVGVIGCDNSCVVFVSNPGGGGGTISGNLNSCPLNQAKGGVRTTVASSFSVPTNDATNRVSHIYMTIRGIEANPSATAADDSPDWLELAPKLLAQPVQLDLLAPRGDSHALDTLEYVAVPADAYRQIRLRLAPDQPDSSDSIPQQNSCGSAGANCIVTSDEIVRPVVLDTGLTQIQISSDHIAGGFFRILPEARVTLQIEFKPQSSLFLFADAAVRLVPVFSVDTRSAGDAAVNTTQ